MRSELKESVQKRIFLASPHMSDEGYEQDYVKEAFDTNWIAPLGTNVDSFEAELAQKVDIKAAAALRERGDIVFCPTLTFSATANPIIYQGAVPVFIDSNFETWNMDPFALEQAFEKYPEVKAVLVVHLYGLSADMDLLLKMLQKASEVTTRRKQLERLVILEFILLMEIKLSLLLVVGC